MCVKSLGVARREKAEDETFRYLVQSLGYVVGDTIPLPMIISNALVPFGKSCLPSDIISL